MKPHEIYALKKVFNGYESKLDQIIQNKDKLSPLRVRKNLIKAINACTKLVETTQEETGELLTQKDIEELETNDELIALHLSQLDAISKGITEAEDESLQLGGKKKEVQERQ